MAEPHTVERGIADTSVFIARESGRPLERSRLPSEIAVSAITVGELRAGVLAAADTVTRDRRLSTLTAVLALDAIPVDSLVVEHWALLRLRLRDGGLRMPLNDSWIAATAMMLDVPVVTQDDDFPTLEGLRLIRV